MADTDTHLTRCRLVLAPSLPSVRSGCLALRSRAPGGATGRARGFQFHVRLSLNVNPFPTPGISSRAQSTPCTGAEGPRMQCGRIP